MPTHEIFPWDVLQIFAALDGVAPEEEAQRIMDEEERLEKEHKSDRKE